MSVTTVDDLGKTDVQVTKKEAKKVSEYLQEKKQKCKCPDNVRYLGSLCASCEAKIDGRIRLELTGMTAGLIGFVGFMIYLASLIN